MATEVVEDDEAWLYGDENKEEANKDEKPAEEKPSAGNGVKAEDKEAGELSGEEEAQDKDEDSDSDDDNVQVTIGDIKTWNGGDASTPRNLFKSAGYQKPSSAVAAPKVPTKGVDLEVPGTINGASTYEFDFDSLKNEDKPWRKPGADITDYFNYGFTEETWQLYCDKQRKLRLENNVTNLSSAVTKPSQSNLTPVPTRSEKETVSSISTTLTELRRAAPPPNRKLAGTIDVIGGTAKDSRRPSIEGGEPIPVAGAPQYRKYQPPPVVPHLGVPPPMTHLPPPNYSIPPPGMLPPPGLPPTNIPPPPGVSLPPPGFPPAAPYDTYFHEPPPHSSQSDGREGGAGYEDRPNYSFDNSRTSFTSTFSDSHHNQPQHWEPQYEERWSDYRSRSPSRSESDYSRGDTYWRDRGERNRERDRDRGERDSYRDRSRDYDRGREKDRDMERSRDRDGSRDHGSRDDKHRSSRRKHRDEEDLDHHRSKHKKSKKKRDKEEEPGEGGMPGEDKAE